jgi:hypothetical protein
LKSIFLPIWNGLLERIQFGQRRGHGQFGRVHTVGRVHCTYLAPVIGTVLGGAFNIVGKIASGVITLVGQVVRVLNGLIGGAIDGINALIKAYNFANNIFGGKDIGLFQTVIVGWFNVSAGVPAVSTKFQKFRHFQQVVVQVVVLRPLPVLLEWPRRRLPIWALTCAKARNLKDQWLVTGQRSTLMFQAHWTRKALPGQLLTP